MAQYDDPSRSLRLDPDSRPGGYVRLAVYNHWDPYEDVPQALLDIDRQRLVDDEDATEAEFDSLGRTVALFGAREDVVTENLAQLAMVLEDVYDQLVVTCQIYR